MSGLPSFPFPKDMPEELRERLESLIISNIMQAGEDGSSIDTILGFESLGIPPELLLMFGCICTDSASDDDDDVLNFVEDDDEEVPDLLPPTEPSRAAKKLSCNTDFASFNPGSQEPGIKKSKKNGKARARARARTQAAKEQNEAGKAQFPGSQSTNTQAETSHTSQDSNKRQIATEIFRTAILEQNEGISTQLVKAILEQNEGPSTQLVEAILNDNGTETNEESTYNPELTMAIALSLQEARAKEQVDAIERLGRIGTIVATTKGVQQAEEAALKTATAKATKAKDPPGLNNASSLTSSFKELELDPYIKVEGNEERNKADTKENTPPPLEPFGVSSKKNTKPSISESKPRPKPRPVHTSGPKTAFSFYNPGLEEANPKPINSDEASSTTADKSGKSKSSSRSRSSSKNRSKRANKC
jgi:hypothetical protein